jgi:hypothetical protein
MRRIDRREFGKETGLAFLSGVAISITACGGGSGNPTGGTPPTTLGPGGPTDEVGDISANHGHRAVVTAAQITAGGAVPMDISGTAGHPHSIMLPAAAVLDIKNGKPVEVRSTTNDGHEHIVTFNADVPSPPTRY